MVFVHDLFEEVVDVELGAGIDYGVDFVEEFFEVEAFGEGDVFEVYLAVDGLDDADFHPAFVGYGANAEFFGADDVVFFAVAFDEGAEFFAVFLGFAGAYAGDVLHLVEGDGVGGGHGVKGGVLEDDVGGEVFLFGHFAAQVFEHGVELGVGCAGSAVVGGFFFYHVFEVCVDCYFEGVWFL